MTPSWHIISIALSLVHSSQSHPLTFPTSKNRPPSASACTPSHWCSPEGGAAPHKPGEGGIVISILVAVLGRQLGHHIC